MKSFNFLKRFIDKAQAFRLAQIAGFFHNLASTKGGFNKKRKPQKRSGGKPERKRYEWGKLGASKVAEAMLKDSGVIRTRAERKLIAKLTGKPFKLYYNGPVNRGYHKIKPSNYSRRKRA